MAARICALLAGLSWAAALFSGNRQSLSGPYHNFVQKFAGELVPHSALENFVHKDLDLSTSDACLAQCEANRECIAAQIGAVGQSSCVLRVMHTDTPMTCAAWYRDRMQKRGFGDIPMVPVEKDDGAVFVRDDCIDTESKALGNTYCGRPWQWNQPSTSEGGSGISLVHGRGYGVSPLLRLVTPGVLDDVIEGGPDRKPWKQDLPDGRCSDPATQWRSFVEKLGSGQTGKNGHAIIADIGMCICSMLSNGWDPSTDLKSDVVFLLYRDENFSPASPWSTISWASAAQTRVPCVQRGGSASKFATDEEAFTAMANSPRVLGMYFVQTPPISHDKVFLMPLGVDMKNWVPSVRKRLQTNSPAFQERRTALYEVSHNLVIDYRTRVFDVVQANFGPQPLHQRHLPYAAGPRMARAVNESMKAVFGQSPPGVGENCYRHAELLLTGTIPVVQASLGVAALRYLPHLAVRDWHEVTPEKLQLSYQQIWAKASAGHYSLEPLTYGFWRQHILDTASGRPRSPFYSKLKFPNPPVTCPGWNCTTRR